MCIAHMYMYMSIVFTCIYSTVHVAIVHVMYVYVLTFVFCVYFCLSIYC